MKGLCTHCGVDRFPPVPGALGGGRDTTRIQEPSSIKLTMLWGTCSVLSCGKAERSGELQIVQGHMVKASCGCRAQTSCVWSATLDRSRQKQPAPWLILWLDTLCSPALLPPPPPPPQRGRLWLHTFLLPLYPFCDIIAKGDMVLLVFFGRGGGQGGSIV